MGFDFTRALGFAAPIIGSAFGPVGASIGGALSSGFLGSQSADEQSDISQAQFNQTRSDLAPYRDAGTNALNQYQGGIGGYNQNLPQYNPADYQAGGNFNFNLENDPIYQNSLNQSIKAADRGNASIGGYNSGNRLAELAQVGARESSKYQNDAFNRQFSTDRENFGRGLTDYGIRDDRANKQFGIASGQEQDLYGRNQNYLSQLQGLAGSGQNAANFTGQAGAVNASNQINANQFGANSINNAIQGGTANAILGNYLNQNQNYQPQDDTSYYYG